LLWTRARLLAQRVRACPVQRTRGGGSRGGTCACAGGAMCAGGSAADAWWWMGVDGMEHITGVGPHRAAARGCCSTRPLPAITKGTSRPGGPARAAFPYPAPPLDLPNAHAHTHTHMHTCTTLLGGNSKGPLLPACGCRCCVHASHPPPPTSTPCPQTPLPGWRPAEGPSSWPARASSCSHSRPRGWCSQTRPLCLQQGGVRRWEV